MKDTNDLETYAIIGAAMAVHNELGSGFLEAVYQDAFEIELDMAKIPYEREKSFSVIYKDSVLKSNYKGDFTCYDSVIVELKASKSLTSIDESQVINYLKVSGFKKALLINFGRSRLEYKRMVLNLS